MALVVVIKIKILMIKAEISVQNKCFYVFGFATTATIRIFSISVLRNFITSSAMPLTSWTEFEILGILLIYLQEIFY